MEFIKLKWFGIFHKCDCGQIFNELMVFNREKMHTRKNWE